MDGFFDIESKNGVVRRGKGGEQERCGGEGVRREIKWGWWKEGGACL